MTTNPTLTSLHQTLAAVGVPPAQIAAGVVDPSRADCRLLKAIDGGAPVVGTRSQLGEAIDSGSLGQGPDAALPPSVPCERCEGRGFHRFERDPDGNGGGTSPCPDCGATGVEQAPGGGAEDAPSAKALRFGAEIVRRRDGRFDIVAGTIEWWPESRIWTESRQQNQYHGCFVTEADALAALNAAPPPPGWVDPTLPPPQSSAQAHRLGCVCDECVRPDPHDGVPADVRGVVTPDEQAKVAPALTEDDKRKAAARVIREASYVASRVADLIWAASVPLDDFGASHLEAIKKYLADLERAIDTAKGRAGA